jgi:SEL1 protein
MGKRLVPLTQYKSLTQALIDRGGISEDPVEAWNEKVKQKEHFDHILRNANSGDAEAMYRVGLFHMQGLYGSNRGGKTSFTWMQKAHDACNVKSTALLGDCFRRGWGVTPCQQQGLFYTTMAATQCSDLATIKLGCMLADRVGIPINEKEAIKWFQEGLYGNCPHRHLEQMCSGWRTLAQTKLNELLSSAAANVSP